jgi:hypothetical protein
LSCRRAMSANACPRTAASSGEQHDAWADEAVQLVNANPYGLAFSVLTGDVGRGLNVAARIDCGAVHINAPAVKTRRICPSAV